MDYVQSPSMGRPTLRQMEQQQQNSAPPPGRAWGSAMAPVGRGYCTLCNKSFSMLRRHVNSIHTREVVITCEICLREFYRKDHWKTHMKNVHNCT